MNLPGSARWRHAREAIESQPALDPVTAATIRAAVGKAMVTDAVIDEIGRLPRPRRERSRKRKGGSLIGSIMGLVVAGFFISIGSNVFFAFQDESAIASGDIVRVDGLVVETSNPMPDGACDLTVSFTTPEGERRFILSDYPEVLFCSLRPGSSAPVVYPDGNPDRARLAIQGGEFRETSELSDPAARAIFLGLVGVFSLVIVRLVAGFLVRLAALISGWRMQQSAAAQLVGSGPMDASVAEAARRARIAFVNLRSRLPIDEHRPDLDDRKGFTAAVQTIAADFEAGIQSAQRSVPVPPTVSSPSPSVPATPYAPGWYPAGDGIRMRWHDGDTWTDHYQG